uniref:Uncharacterized protein n=1 Tax=Arundo donax TaxID=35708 RepID=A0A0A9A5L9_ARUDO
MGAMASILQFW